MTMLAIEVAPTRVTAAEFSRGEGDGISWGNVAVEPFAIELTSPEGSAASAVAFQNLARLFPGHRRCVLALAGSLALTKWLTVSSDEWDQRSALMGFEAERTLPLPLSELVWSAHAAFRGEGEVDVMMSAAKIASVEMVLGAAKAVGWSVELVVPSAYALARTLERNPPTAGSALVVDVGESATNLVFVSAQRFFLRTVQARVPSGGAEAEVADERSEFVAKIAGEAVRSIGAFRRRPGSAIPQRIYVLGDDALAMAVSRALQEKLRLPVESFDGAPLAAPSFDGPSAEGTLDLGTRLMLAGLATSGEGESGFNLLPREEIAARAFRRRQPWLLASAVVAILAIAPVAWHFQNLGRAGAEKLAAVEAQLGPARSLLARNAADRQRIVEMQAQGAAFERLLREKSTWLRTLAELQERLAEAEDAWVDRLRSVGDDRLFISGRMLHRDRDARPAREERFFQILGESKLVSAIEDRSCEPVEEGLLRFAVTLVLKPEGDR